jgi:hypothetical protein
MQASTFYGPNARWKEEWVAPVVSGKPDEMDEMLAEVSRAYS